LKVPITNPHVLTPNLAAANGQALRISGTINVNVCLNGFNFGHEFIVLKDLRQQGLLGLDFLQHYRGDVSVAS